jgi:RNase adaptor protein for sRNA GlmZ degradation
VPKKLHNEAGQSGPSDLSEPQGECFIEDKSPAEARVGNKNKYLTVQIITFGYKTGSLPNANMMFDVRFLQNPFWIEELRDRTGLEKPVQDYVLSQPLAQEFVSACIALLERLLPKLAEQGTDNFTVAFGCTGGQHRSVSIAESIGKSLRESNPDYIIRISHRELDGSDVISEDLSNKPSCKAKS